MAMRLRIPFLLLGVQLIVSLTAMFEVLLTILYELLFEDILPVVTYVLDVYTKATFYVLYLSYFCLAHTFQIIVLFAFSTYTAVYFYFRLCIFALVTYALGYALERVVDATMERPIYMVPVALAVLGVPKIMEVLHPFWSMLNRLDRVIPDGIANLQILIGTWALRKKPTPMIGIRQVESPTYADSEPVRNNSETTGMTDDPGTQTMGELDRTTEMIDMVDVKLVELQELSEILGLIDVAIDAEEEWESESDYDNGPPIKKIKERYNPICRQ